jgi:hypothetical protein
MQILPNATIQQLNFLSSLKNLCMNERFGVGFLRLLSEVSQEKLHCLSKANCAALGNVITPKLLIANSACFFYGNGTVRANYLTHLTGNALVRITYSNCRCTIQSEHFRPYDNIHRAFFNAKAAAFAKAGKYGPYALHALLGYNLIRHCHNFNLTPLPLIIQYPAH